LPTGTAAPSFGVAALAVTTRVVDDAAALDVVVRGCISWPIPEEGGEEEPAALVPSEEAVSRSQKIDPTTAPATSRRASPSATARGWARLRRCLP